MVLPLDMIGPLGEDEGLYDIGSNLISVSMGLCAMKCGEWVSMKIGADTCGGEGCCSAKMAAGDRGDMTGGESILKPGKGLRLECPEV